MKPLVIFELANNHMGKLSHAKLIIDKYYRMSKKFRDKIDFALKFQYRDLPTFIHPSFMSSQDKQVLRFKDTYLSKEHWRQILQFSKKKFKLICTPFDEISVKKIINDKFDFLKIASCSATDWPLVEYIAKKAKRKKIICSLGGLSKDEISSVISYFTTRKMKINFLYCVAKYPTDQRDLNLIYFQELQKTYGKKVLGISLHEGPDQFLSGSIGYSMGARIFEKHIGVSRGKIKLNKYSVDTHQMEKWLNFLYLTIDQVGEVKNREKNVQIEKKQLRNFQRGVYLKNKQILNKDEYVQGKKIVFQFPAVKGQVTANLFSKFTKFKAQKKVLPGKPIFAKDTILKNQRSKISEIRDKIRYLVNRAKIIVPSSSRLEISHHYGLNDFYKYGLSMITVVNQAYCKKYLFMFKNQRHPAQFHKIKQETFLMLFGTIKLKLKSNGRSQTKIMKPGQVFTISRGVIHEFKATSNEGAIIEEISSEHIKTDSFYLDKKINKNKNRKSIISLY